MRFAGILLASLSFAADVSGIWTGQQQGRRGEREDVAFRFKTDGQKLTGQLFGDEFDIPIADASLAGDQIRFTITTTNYYSGNKTVFVYTGTVKGNEMELVRERVPNADEKQTERPMFRQTITIKRLNDSRRP